MKSLISAALFVLVTASAAQAEVKIEPRVFHSNLRLDASHGSESFANTAGAGVSGIYVADRDVDLGLGYSVARYYASTTQTDLHTVSAFAHYKLSQTESGTFYALLGVSNLQLDQHQEAFHDSPYTDRTSITFDPLLNAEIGLGGSIKVGSADLGLQYKYSSSLSKGAATINIKETGGSLAGHGQAKISGIVAEQQEVSLTLGLPI